MNVKVEVEVEVEVEMEMEMEVGGKLGGEGTADSRFL